MKFYGSEQDYSSSPYFYLGQAAQYMKKTFIAEGPEFMATDVDNWVSEVITNNYDSTLDSFVVAINKLNATMANDMAI